MSLSCYPSQTCAYNNLFALTQCLCLSEIGDWLPENSIVLGKLLPVVQVSRFSLQHHLCAYHQADRQSSSWALGYFCRVAQHLRVFGCVALATLCFILELAEVYIHVLFNKTIILNINHKLWFLYMNIHPCAMNVKPFRYMSH